MSHDLSKDTIQAWSSTALTRIPLHVICSSMFYWATKLMYRRFELLDLGPPFRGHDLQPRHGFN